MTEHKDYWLKDDSIFVCDGQKFAITPIGLTVGVCLATGAMHKLPGQKLGALAPQLKGNLPPPQKAEVLLHKNQGGRPRKPGGEPVSRMTEWRRAKEKQGVLL